MPAFRTRSRLPLFLLLPLLMTGCADPERPARPKPELVPGEIAGPVIKIRDGDTFCLPDACIRLWGVDAPERAEPGGSAATAALTALIADGWVRCVGRGRSYDRTVGLCRDEAGRDVAAEMVQRGWAWDWPRYSGGRYAALERSARAARRGVWGRL